MIELLITATKRQLSAEELGAINECFVQAVQGGLDNTLGITYIALGPDSVESRLVVDERHLQPWGVANGGMYCAMGESLGSIAGFIATGGQANVMGVNNNTDFFRPTRKGDVVRAAARPVNLGRTSQIWEILMVNEDTGKLVARTNLRLAVIPSGE